MVWEKHISIHYSKKKKTFYTNFRQIFFALHYIKFGYILLGSFYRTGVANIRNETYIKSKMPCRSSYRFAGYGGMYTDTHGVKDGSKKRLL
jgi:hypothetical protein